MKKNKIEFFYPILATIASIFLCTIIWDNITINYSNPYEIIGEYSKNAHSTYNDTLRYLVFISLPVISFFSIFLINKNKNYYNLDLNIFSLKKKFFNNQNVSIKFLIFFSLLALILFLLEDWNVWPLHIFEEGMPLSGSTILDFNQKPWKDVYLNTGFFYDMLNGKISWFLTGYETIGSFKFYIKFLNLISILLIIYFLFEISNQIAEEKIKTLFFVFCSISILFIFKHVDFWRDIPLLIFLISILKYLNSRNFFYLLTISFISVFTFFWSLDRGFFIILSLIPFFVFILLNNRKDFIKLIFFIIIFWIMAVSIIGIDIFLSFIEHAKEIFTQHEYINGLIHPQPFSKDPDSARATKSLLLIIFNFIISILIIFNKKEYFINNTKFLFIFFSVLNFLIYKTALSRSDGGHIKMATYFSIILFTIFLIYFILYYLNKNKSFFEKNTKKINTFIIILIFLIFKNYNTSIMNFYTFPKNIKNLIIENDKKFINDEYKKSISKLSNLLSESDCLQAFSYDQAIFYLLKKKSCSKFYNVWVIGSKKNQQIYINELKFNQPKYILTGGLMKAQSLNERYPYIKDYISKEYSLYEEFYSWKILKKID